jgi:hypothetical protein
MRFQDTTFYKEFGNNADEWKVVTNDGKVYVGKGWKKEYEDSNYKEATLYVAEKPTESLSIVRSKSKTIITPKFKAT